MPLFSIIVPTTRARLLKYSLGSILAQTFTDFEVVVSDNFATGVDVAIAELKDDRVRYVRTPRRLAINESWEYPLDFVKGSWVLLLADDDVMTPSLLADVKSVIDSNPDGEIVTWGYGSYVDADYPGLRSGAMAMPPYSGEVTVNKSADLLMRLFQFGGRAQGDFGRFKRHFPTIMCSAYRMEIVAEIRSQVGMLFLPWIPDYAAATAMLAYTKIALKLDKPLTILNSTSDSNGAGAAGDLTILERMLSEFPDPPFQYVPYKGYIVSQNIIADTILNVQMKLGKRLSQYEFDWVAYFANIYYAFRVAEAGGGQIAHEEAQFFEVLAKQRKDIRSSVESCIRDSTPSSVNRPASAYLRLRMMVSELRVAAILRSGPLLKDAFIQGFRKRGLSTRARYAGIENILQFAALVGRFLGDSPAAHFRPRDK